ncbi:MAG: WHG domain-containing protein, partial [Actinobacteria bacterium]|nr:WHG domain-containing protein [Actinomycetota bacterium]
TVLVSILADGHAAGTLKPPAAEPKRLPKALRADLAAATRQIAPGLPEELLLLGMTSWLELFGAVSFELFGQLNNVIEARAQFFDQQMELMCDLMGL